MAFMTWQSLTRGKTPHPNIPQMSPTKTSACNWIPNFITPATSSLTRAAVLATDPPNYEKRMPLMPLAREIPVRVLRSRVLLPHPPRSTSLSRLILAACVENFGAEISFFFNCLLFRTPKRNKA